MGFNFIGVNTCKLANEHLGVTLVNGNYKLDRSFRKYYKIYIYVTAECVLEEFEKILNVLYENDLLCLGKIALLNKMYYEFDTPRIILYVDTKEKKDNLLKRLDQINWNPKSQVKNIELRFKKRFNSRIAWNQGGDSIREKASEDNSLNRYFEGENYHLIKDEMIDQ